MKKHQILIIGGGSAGIMTAGQLLKKDQSLDIAVIEPADTHYYQPAWTLVGAGTYDYEKTARPMSEVMPSGVTWIKEYASGFNPDKNEVLLKNGEQVGYDYLVVAPGLAYDLSLVEGLKEAMDKGVVVSNYTDPKAVWKALKEFKGGTALFTQPTTPIKCGGAPQKIAYLGESYFHKSGVRSKTDVVFAFPGGVIFGVKEIAKTLMEVVERKDINLRYGYQLKKVDPDKKIAWYTLGDNTKEFQHKDVKSIEENGMVGIPFDFMHTAPPSVAPQFVAESALVNDAGWLDVDINTMQHKKFANIFGLGDVAALPTAKTGAAIRKQVPIVVDNLMHLMKSNVLGSMSYNGYSSCPLVTDYGKMVLAEFDYQNNFTPDPKLKQMLVFDSSKEHWRLWMLKKYILPNLYWNKMMKGVNV